MNTQTPLQQFIRLAITGDWADRDSLFRDLDNLGLSDEEKATLLLIIKTKDHHHAHHETN